MLKWSLISVRGIQGDSTPFSGSLGDMAETLYICFHLYCLLFIVLLRSGETYCVFSQEVRLIRALIYFIAASPTWAGTRSMDGCTDMKAIQGECSFRAGLVELRFSGAQKGITGTNQLCNFFPPLPLHQSLYFCEFASVLVCSCS